MELKTRFNDRFKKIIPVESLIPANKDYNIDDISIINLYKGPTGKLRYGVTSWIKLWKLKLTKTDIVEPKSAIET